jgi:Protein of unknown function DUF262
MAKKKKFKKLPKDPDKEAPLESTVGEGAESEEDLDTLDPSLLGKAVVFGTDWTAATLIDQLSRGNVEMDPIFQRRDAWTETRKSKFIESIVLGLPIPQIVLAESQGGKGSFLVIDGKQRLLSLQQFGGIRLQTGNEPLKLTGLTIRKELNTKTYEDLKNDVRLEKHLNAFENQPIRTVVVKNWQKEEVLYLIFHRLNSETLPLSPQELRQALHPGPFLRFAAEYTEHLGGLHRVLGIKRPDFRMRDVELLVRYYAFQHRLAEYAGNLKRFLDDTCKLLNTEWKKKENALIAEAENMERAINAAYEVFGDGTFRKWDGASFEPRFNRAVFDVIVYFFAQESTRKKAVAIRSKVKAAYQKLCVDDPEFLRSIETTTKSKKATTTRFNAWKRQLEKTLGIKFTPAIREAAS